VYEIVRLESLTYNSFLVSAWASFDIARIRKKARDWTLSAEECGEILGRARRASKGSP
jgi:hypothetical protein